MQEEFAVGGNVKQNYENNEAEGKQALSIAPVYLDLLKRRDYLIGRE